MRKLWDNMEFRMGQWLEERDSTGGKGEAMGGPRSSQVLEVEERCFGIDCRSRGTDAT